MVRYVSAYVPPCPVRFVSRTIHYVSNPANSVKHIILSFVICCLLDTCNLGIREGICMHEKKGEI